MCRAPVFGSNLPHLRVLVRCLVRRVQIAVPAVDRGRPQRTADLVEAGELSVDGRVAGDETFAARHGSVGLSGAVLRWPGRVAEVVLGVVEGPGHRADLGRLVLVGLVRELEDPATCVLECGDPLLGGPVGPERLGVDPAGFVVQRAALRRRGADTDSPAISSVVQRFSSSVASAGTSARSFSCRPRHPNLVSALSRMRSRARDTAVVNCSMSTGTISPRDDV